MKTKSYSSKEEFERKNPYVIVCFENRNNQTIAVVAHSCSTKKQADAKCATLSGHEVMTRRKFNEIITSLV